MLLSQLVTLDSGNEFQSSVTLTELEDTNNSDGVLSLVVS